MKIGIIGRGPWGNAYAETLERMGVEHWQATHEYGRIEADGIVIASPGGSHYGIAAPLIERHVPVLIEKPVCMNSSEAKRLRVLALENDAVVFVGHTRLYSGAWRAFKERALLQGVHSVCASAGGGCKLSPLWDWGPHLVSMCLDIGFDPLMADLEMINERIHFEFTVNGSMTYVDTDEQPRPMEVLLTEFIGAIKCGNPDSRGLDLGARVVAVLEKIEHHAEMA